MSYASVDELRTRLPLDANTPPEVFGWLLDDISNAFDEHMEVSFDGEVHSVWLDGGRPRLWLPRPGAALNQIMTVIEDGGTLDLSDYELDPGDGLFLTRLDADGQPQNWTAGKRIVRVTYTAKSAPGSLRQACLDEAVNAWKGRSAGRSGTVGENGTRYAKAFSDDTRSLLRRLKARYGNA